MLFLYEKDTSKFLMLNTEKLKKRLLTLRRDKQRDSKQPAPLDKLRVRVNSRNINCPVLKLVVQS